VLLSIEPVRFERASRSQSLAFDGTTITVRSWEDMIYSSMSV
jgi:hypothetical protein